jgi:SAM-dependent methyltransferase
MERLEADEFDRFPVARLEHLHRYECAAGLSRGRVMDIACGTGYGAAILLAQPGVSEYIGIDTSEASIAYAQLHQVAGARFALGSATELLEFEDESFDTIVSLETLEHLPCPELAMAEFRRLLAPAGLFIGSVPTEAFEHFCTKLYGPNVFHLQTFSQEQLRQYLEVEFNHVEIFLMRVCIGVGVFGAGGGPCLADRLELSPAATAEDAFGSFFFVASQQELPADLIGSLGAFIVAGSYFEAESLQVDRLLASKYVEKSFAGLLAQQVRLVASKNEAMRNATALVLAKDEQLVAADLLVAQKDALLRDCDALIAAKDARLLDLEGRVVRAEAQSRDADALLAAKDQLLGAFDALIVAKDRRHEELVIQLAKKQAEHQRSEALVATFQTQADLADALTKIKDKLLRQYESIVAGKDSLLLATQRTTCTLNKPE